MPADDFDPRAYLHHFDDCAMGEADKIAVIEAMWMLAKGFADRAFGLTPGQHLPAETTRKNGNHDNEMVQSRRVGRVPETPANDNTPPPKRKGTALK